MKVGLRRILIGTAGTTALCLLGAALSWGQAAPQQKPLLAEQVFKNVQVLRGIPVNEFMETMGFFSASLNETCTYCHVEQSGGDWARYADDTPKKQTARMMVLMMNAINQGYFGGKREVTCYSCHRGNIRPKVTPTIAGVYSPAAPPDEPDELLPKVPDEPTAAQVLDKYIQALGGEKALSALTSFVAKGTYQGYAEAKHPVEIYAKAPDQLTTIVHTFFGDRTTTYNGREGWLAMPIEDRPVPVTRLTEGDLNGARLDAILSFPGQIKQALSQWRVSYPITINDRDVEVVQGTSDGRTPVNLYFDKQTGLLVRQERFSDSKIGLYATQINYSDYREVAGVRMPFHWVVSWLDGQADIELTDVQPNVSISANKFAKPSPPKAPPKAAR